MRGLLKIFIFAIALLLPCMMVGQEVETQCQVQVQEYRVFEVSVNEETKIDSVLNLENDGKGNLFVLGVIEFDSLVRILPKGKDLFSICMENEMVKGMTARINKSRWNYNIFNPDCYYFFTSSSASLWYNILPYLPEKYFNLVLRTYPHRFEGDRLSDCFINDYVSANKTQIHSLKYRTYLCVLMKVTYFNITRIKGMRAYKKPTYLFHNSKFLEGLYIKVLIPLVDED